MAEIQSAEQAQRLARGMQAAIQQGSATPEQIERAKQALTAWRDRGAQPFDATAAQAGAVPTGDAESNLKAALEGAVPALAEATGPLAAAADFGSRALAGVGAGIESAKRGIKQLVGTPQEAQAVAQVEQAARDQWEEFDEGLGPEDVGEVAFFLGSLALPGGAPTQAAATGGKVINAVKNLPKTWAPWAAMAGLAEFVTGKTEDEVRGVEALQAAGLTAAGGVVGNKLGGLVANKFAGTGAGGTLAATLGAVAGPRLSRRIFAEGIFRRMSRALTGKQAVATSDPLERALLRQGGQEDARIIRDAAKVAGTVAARPGITDETIGNFLDEFPKIVKSIRQTKASKEAGLGLKELRNEANTMLDLLQQKALKTDPQTGVAVIDVAELKKAYGQMRKNKKFSTIFSGPKQKQMDAMVDSYVKAATTANKNVADVAKPFETALNSLDNRRTQGLKETEEYLASRLGRKPDPRFGTATAVGTWMLGNDISPDQIRQAFVEEGWASQLGLFETIAEQVENAEVEPTE